MRSNEITKSIEETEETAVDASGMVEPERKAYHTPELVALGEMREERLGGDSLTEDEC
jgi:hypothetical protein